MFFVLSSDRRQQRRRPSKHVYYDFLSRSMILIAGRLVVTFLSFQLFFTREILANPTTPIATLQNVTARAAHTATLIDNKLYIIGGETFFTSDASDVGSQVNFSSWVADSCLVLDVSQSFSVQTPPWKKLDSLDFTHVAGHSAVTGGPNNSQIIVFGGLSQTSNGSSLLIYDTLSKNWSNPQLGSEPPRRIFHSAAVTSTGEMFIYGGAIPLNLFSFNATPLADFWALDTVSLERWFVPSTVPTPGNRLRHTASVVESKIILLGGGDGKFAFYDLQEITYFDTATGSWKTVNATGVIPQQRHDHSAVVKGDEIIIYGGSQHLAPLGDVAVLNTTSWTWSIPPLTNSPSPRFLHSATLVGQNMIVAFGISRGVADNNIYVLDTLNWTWLSTYLIGNDPSNINPNPNNNPNTTPSPVTTILADNKEALIIGLSIGVSILLATLAGITAFVLVIRKRNKRSFVVVNRPPPPPDMMTRRPFDDPNELVDEIHVSRPRPPSINVSATTDPSSRFIDLDIMTLSIPSTPHTPENAHHTPSNSRSMLINSSQSLRLSQPVDLYSSLPSPTNVGRRPVSDVFGSNRPYMDPTHDPSTMYDPRLSSGSLENMDIDVQITENFIVRKGVLRLANPSDPESDEQ